MCANYDPKKLPAKIGDEILVDQVVSRGMANDDVVPYASAGVTKAYLSEGQVTKTLGKSYGTAKNPKTTVWHTNFFVQRHVREGLPKYASPG